MADRVRDASESTPFVPHVEGGPRWREGLLRRLLSLLSSRFGENRRDQDTGEGSYEVLRPHEALRPRPDSQRSGVPDSQRSGVMEELGVIRRLLNQIEQRIGQDSDEGYEYPSLPPSSIEMGPPGSSGPSEFGQGTPSLESSHSCLRTSQSCCSFYQGSGAYHSAEDSSCLNQVDCRTKSPSPPQEPSFAFTVASLGPGDGPSGGGYYVLTKRNYPSEGYSVLGEEILGLIGRVRLSQRKREQLLEALSGSPSQPGDRFEETVKAIQHKSDALLEKMNEFLDSVKRGEGPDELLESIKQLEKVSSSVKEESEKCVLDFKDEVSLPTISSAEAVTDEGRKKTREKTSSRRTSACTRRTTGKCQTVRNVVSYIHHDRVTLLRVICEIIRLTESPETSDPSGGHEGGLKSLLETFEVLMENRNKKLLSCFSHQSQRVTGKGSQDC